MVYAKLDLISRTVQKSTFIFSPTLYLKAVFPIKIDVTSCLKFRKKNSEKIKIKTKNISDVMECSWMS